MSVRSAGRQATPRRAHFFSAFARPTPTIDELTALPQVSVIRVGPDIGAHHHWSVREEGA